MDSVEETLRQGNTTLVAKTAEDIIPLNYQEALNSLTEVEKKEVIKLSEKIDVTQLEKAMVYGSEVLRKTFDQCGQFLKSERGSQADQEVIKRVVELTKKASESYDDFEMVIQEPNFFEKLLLKISSARRKNKAEKVKFHALTNYKLLSELKISCEAWLDMLKKAMGDISYSELEDSENLVLLEKYIIAGEMAKAKVEKQLEESKKQYEQTGLRADAQKYDELKDGYEIFVIRLNNLEKSRVMYYLSIGQLNLVKRSNRNVQVAIHTQSENCTTLIGQQLRNAVLNAKNQEVIEGQKALARLSDELIKDVSNSIGITSEEAEKLLYYGVYNVDAAKDAIKSVISSCDNVKHVAEEMLPKMQTDVVELNQMIEELKPYIDGSENLQNPTTNVSNTSNADSRKLTF